MATPQCSVVICTKGRPRQLERCLATLCKMDHPSFELIVVDNSDGDENTRSVAERYGARIVVEPVVGLTRSRNTGAIASRGEIVAFIDDDATTAPDWLTHHSAALSDVGLSATTGRVMPLFPDEPDARAYAAAGGEDLLGVEPFRVDKTVDSWFERANFGGIGLGTNMVFRRSLFEGGWGFHETLGGATVMGGDENYAFFSLIRDGHAIGYVPEAVVFHEGAATAASAATRRRRIEKAAAVYLVMLFVGEPGYRKATLRYAAQGLRGTERNWREETGQPVRRSDRLTAGLMGVFLYLRFWRAFRRDRPPPPPPPPQAGLSW